MFNNNINLFKFCSALRVLGYFMILLFAAIVALTYYAVVFVTWCPLLFPFRFSTSSFSALSILLLFHTLVSHPSFLNLFNSFLTPIYIILLFLHLPPINSTNWRRRQQQHQHHPPPVTVLDAKTPSHHVAIIALSVKGVFLRWIIIVFGSSIVLGHETTSIFFSSCCIHSSRQHWIAWL